MVGGAYENNIVLNQSFPTHRNLLLNYFQDEPSEVRVTVVAGEKATSSTLLDQENNRLSPSSQAKRSNSSPIDSDDFVSTTHSPSD